VHTHAAVFRRNAGSKAAANFTEGAATAAESMAADEPDERGAKRYSVSPGSPHDPATTDNRRVDIRPLARTPSVAVAKSWRRPRDRSMASSPKSWFFAEQSLWSEDQQNDEDREYD
jgi:hypothetical protein